jgi:hypothetical protein
MARVFIRLQIDRSFFFPVQRDRCIQLNYLLQTTMKRKEERQRQLKNKRERELKVSLSYAFVRIFDCGA